jgi:hypothetical protein
MKRSQYWEVRETENTRLRAELEAAKRDLFEAANCRTCKHEGDRSRGCVGICFGDMWEWRGLCDENGGAK